jgi:hypothetical protein
MKEKEYTSLTEFLDDIVEALSKSADLDLKQKVEDNSNKNENKTKESCVLNDTLSKCGDSIAKKNTYSQPQTKTVPGNITIDNFDHYILNEMVNGWPTYNEQHLIFEQYTEEGYKVPGITENQLLSVLYNRYKNNPKKLDLVRQLMA